MPFKGSELALSKAPLSCFYLNLCYSQNLEKRKERKKHMEKERGAQDLTISRFSKLRNLQPAIRQTKARSEHLNTLATARLPSQPVCKRAAPHIAGSPAPCLSYLCRFFHRAETVSQSPRWLNQMSHVYPCALEGGTAGCPLQCTMRQWWCPVLTVRRDTPLLPSSPSSRHANISHSNQAKNVHSYISRSG
jgi:hypothetical protein